MSDRRFISICATWATVLAVASACDKAEPKHHVAPDWYISAVQRDQDDLEWCMTQGKMPKHRCISDYDDSRADLDAELGEDGYVSLTEAEWEAFKAERKAIRAEMNTPAGKRARMVAANERAEGREAHRVCSASARKRHPVTSDPLTDSGKAAFMARHAEIEKCMKDWQSRRPGVPQCVWGRRTGCRQSE